MPSESPHITSAGVMRHGNSALGAVHANARHVARLFYDQAVAGRQMPLYWKQLGNRLAPVARNEAAEWIGLYARGLQSLGIARGARIALLDISETLILPMLIAHSLLGLTSVVFSEDLTPEERAKLLSQSQCALLVVENAAEVPAYERQGDLSSVQGIVALHGTPPPTHGKRVGRMKVHGLEALVEAGRGLPDRTSQVLQAVRLEEPMLMLGILHIVPHDPGDAPEHYRRTELSLRNQTQIFQSIDDVERILAEAHLSLAPGDIVITHPALRRGVDLAACLLLPLANGCSLHRITPPMPDVEQFQQLHPHLLISDSAYLIELHRRLERSVTEGADRLDAWAARTMLRLGKKRYESSGTLSFWDNRLLTVTRQMAGNRLRALLGPNLRGILCIDEGVPYPTQLFYETLGIRMAEIPAVFEEKFEKTRL